MARTVSGSGAVIEPIFDEFFGVRAVLVKDGGSGYVQSDPPRLTVDGCGTPDEEALLYPLLMNPQEKLFMFVFLLEVVDMIHLDFKLFLSKKLQLLQIPSILIEFGRVIPILQPLEVLVDLLIDFVSYRIIILNPLQFFQREHQEEGHELIEHVNQLFPRKAVKMYLTPYLV